MLFLLQFCNNLAKKTIRCRFSIFALAVFVLLGVLLFCVFADRIMARALFHPWKPNADWKPTTPNCESVQFSTADGSVLDALYFPCENPRGFVLYSHGNGETLKSIEPLGELYREKFQVSILMYDYRGYGRSEGRPTAPGILEDGRAARKWLCERESIDVSQIIQMGYSLGGSVAIDLASLDGAKALIVQSTFSSLPEIANSRIPLIPYRKLFHEQLNSVEKIRIYHGPLFLSHGTVDGTIPFSQGKKLAESAGGETTFYPIERGRHNPPNDEQYFDAVVMFLDNGSLERSAAK